MVEHSQLWEVKEIIAFLKRQNENKNSEDSFCEEKLISKKNAPARSDISHICGDNFQHNTSVNGDITQLRNESAVTRFLSCTQVEVEGNNYEIKKVNDYRSEQGCDTNDRSRAAINIIYDTAQNRSDNANASNSQTVTVNDKNIVDSEEIIRKCSKGSTQTKNNKWLKSNSTNTNKQLDITEFYNSVKSVNSYGNKYPYKLTDKTSTSKSHKSAVDERSKNFNRINSDQKENHTFVKANHFSAKKDDEFLSSFENNFPANISNQKFNHVTNKQKAVQKIQMFNTVQRHNDSQKTLSVDTSKCTKTIDDFCNKIYNDIKSKEKDNFCKPNPFLKYYSTGTIHQENENCKETNSVPITGCELRTAKRKLEDNNNAFDNFLKKIMKKMSDIGESTISELDDRDISYNHNKEESLKVIPKSDICNKNKLKNSDNVNLIVPLCDESHILSIREESHSINFHSTDTFKENTDNISNSIFFNNNDDTNQHTHSIGDEQISGSKDLYVTCSQFTQRYVDNDKIESVITNNKSTFEGSVLNADSETDNIEKFYMCPSTNCVSQNSLEQLSTTNGYSIKNTNKDTENSKVDKFIRLENFISKISKMNPPSEAKQHMNNNVRKTKFYIKRYRKGKTKIYKLKKLRKKYLKMEEVDEDVTFQEVLKKITNNCENKNKLSRYKSGSSISTPSSYITDIEDTESDSLSTGSKELTSPEQRLRKGFNELSKDKSLSHSAKEWEEATETDKEHIKIKIQDIFLNILEDFKNRKTSFLKHRRQNFSNCVFKDGRLQLKPVNESSMTMISSTAQRSKAKFEIIVYIMKKIQTLLETNMKLTKRELYYQLKTLINDQRVSDRAINAISCLLDVGMWALNIIAQKGLVFGDLKLLLASGEMLNCNIPGTLIPQDINDIVEIHSSAYFILVVEKESIFHKLIEEDLPNKLTRPFIMITGKGFPDLNTQLFLRKLWVVMSIPVFILVDADPHGINIMLNYRFGSVNNAHVSQHLAVPNAKWVGVYPSEIINLNITREPLSEREIRLVNSILNTPYMEFSSKLVDELKVLLENKFKASIEGLLKTDSYLSQVYLPNKFFTHNFI